LRTVCINIVASKPEICYIFILHKRYNEIRSRLDLGTERFVFHLVIQNYKV